VAALVSALVTAICADIVRPSLAWLAASGRDHGELARAMAALRDPEGFARLRALCDSDPAVSKTAGSRTLRRAAVILAARGCDAPCTGPTPPSKTASPRSATT
jgi:hypothetical protein